MPTEPPTSPARAHAAAARELLAGVERTEAQLAALTPDQHMQRIVSGDIVRTNKSLQFTVELAAAQAQTSIALSLATYVELLEKSKP